MFNGQFKNFTLNSVRAGPSHTTVSFESLSEDHRRTRAKIVEARVPSSVKKKQRIGIERPESSVHSEILEAALSNFGPEGFVMVSDSCQLDNVEGLIAAAASRTRRRYTTSVGIPAGFFWEMNSNGFHRISLFLNGELLPTNIWRNS